MRRLVEINNGRDYKAVEVVEGGYPVYGSGGEFRRASDYLHDGPAVLFGRKGTIDRPLLVKGKFWTVDTMFYVVPRERIDVRFLYYVATTIPYGYYVTSTALPSMTQSDLGSYPVPLPPKDQQGVIADFLDRETAQIDTLIAKQQRLIATLRERREAVVERVAVRGLDDVPLAESGIRWAPSLPAHWCVGRFKYDAELRAGGTPDTDDATLWADEPTGETIPWVAISDMSQRDVVVTTKKSLTAAGLASKRLVPGPAGTVLLAMYASVGEVARLGIAATWNQAILGITPRPNKFDARYLAYALRTMRRYMLGEVRSNTQANLNARQVGDMWLPRPPLEEQRRIVAYLDEQTARIDTLIQKSERLIELSQERRAALITAAVTGQIDVRKAA